MHPRYQERYRAIGTETLGCKLVDNAAEAVATLTEPEYREYIETSFKRLDLARTLRRSN